MCTLIILRSPGHPWPLLIAANRDEMSDRPWSPPARHWPDRAEVVAGRDDLADGTWMGINDFGLFAAVLNRRNTLGPQADLRSRGELPLEALDHEEAGSAATALRDLDTASYRSFNLVIADAERAYLLVSRAGGTPDAPPMEIHDIPDGLSMVTAGDMNDTTSPRVRRYLPRFRGAPVPDPDTGDWDAWLSLLAAREHETGSGPEGAMDHCDRTRIRNRLLVIARPSPQAGADSPHALAVRAGDGPMSRRSHRSTFDPLSFPAALF